MPKRIQNLRENILQSAKDILLSQGYDALAIRSVACKCRIAVGTVYNYFPSKDMLAAAVMLEDWEKEMTRMRGACGEAQSTEEALTALYGGVSAFSATYSAVWTGYTFSDSFRISFGKRHKMLVAQLAGCLAPALTRFDVPDAEDCALFLSENVLICTGSSDLTFQQLLHMVRRLLP